MIIPGIWDTQFFLADNGLEICPFIFIINILTVVMKKDKKQKKKTKQPLSKKSRREIIPVGIQEQIKELILLKNLKNICPITEGEKYSLFDSREKKIKSVNDFIWAKFKYDESLSVSIRELQNVDFTGIPGDAEPLCVCLAEFKVENLDDFIRKLDESEDFILQVKYKDGIDYAWTRPYPKNHWNPNSKLEGASQFLAQLGTYNDGTLLCFTKSRGWMSRLMVVLYQMLGQNIELKKLAFKDI